MLASSNTIYSALGRHPVHPFPARMAPEIVCSFIERSEKPIRVLDPMMGSGTVVALAQSRNHLAFGIDIDPLATLIARVWTTPIDHAQVAKKAKQVLSRAKSRAPRTRAATSYPKGADQSTREFIDYWFDGWARRQLFSLSTSINALKDEHVRNALWCAFSRLIIAKQAGASRALDLAHSRPHRFYKRAPLKPFDGFLPAVQSVLKNAMSIKDDVNRVSAAISLGDARELALSSESIDLVLTSPPYLNAIDYIRCSKFSLVWMGHQIDELRNVRSKSVGTEIGREYRHDLELSRIIKSLGVSRLPRQKQRILGAYVDDMRAAITEVARVLVPGGDAVYVIGENTVSGSYIKTAKVLILLAEGAGLKLQASRRRVLPPNKRYMPPPSQGSKTMDSRMRTEVVLHFSKPR